MRELDVGKRRGERQEGYIPPQSVSGPVVILSLIVVSTILIIANALLLDGIFGQFQPPWLLLLLGLEIASVAAAVLMWPELSPSVRWDGLEFLGAATVAAVLIAHAVYLAPSSLMPVSFSVDCSHQHLLVNFIYEHSAFPDGVDYLYIYDDYPVGPSALAALVAQGMNLLPVRTMYPLAVFLMAAQCAIAYGIMVELLPDGPLSRVLGLLGSLLVYVFYPYVVGVFTDRFYSNMMVGDLLVLLALWLSVVRKRLHPLVSTSMTVLLAFGCLHSYPAWLPFVVAPFAAALLTDNRLSLQGRLYHLGSASALVGLSTILAVIDQWDFITWFAPSRGRLLPSTEASFTAALLVLTGLGIIALIDCRRQRSAMIEFLLVDLLCVTGLYVAGALDLISLYLADKTFYFNVFVVIILASLGLDLMRRKAEITWSLRKTVGYVAVMLVGFSAILMINGVASPPSSYPITIDEYRIAYQIAKEMRGVELTYLVRHTTAFYWMYGGVLHKTEDLVEKSEQWATERPTYDSWIGGEGLPERAVVSNVATLPSDGPWRIILSSGSSAVIERTS